MVYTNAQFIDLFIKENPDLEFSRNVIKDVINTTFKAVVNEMRSNRFRQVRLRYFGVFKVYYGRILFHLKNYRFRYLKKSITLAEYKEFVIPLIQYYKDFNVKRDHKNFTEKIEKELEFVKQVIETQDLDTDA